MDVRAIRDRLAGQGPAGILGHARPPGQIADLPAYVVGDPTLVDYHPTSGGRRLLELPITVIVARTVEDDGTGDLDDLMSSFPPDIEAITPGDPALWTGKPAALPVTGGYLDYQVQTDKGPVTIGVAARIPFRLTPT